MKKRICLLIALIMLFLAAAAENALPDATYRNAKEAVSLISYGEYDMALSRLGMGDLMKPSALKKFIGANCAEIYRGSVQTEISVAWNDGEKWFLAVPFEAPDDGAVGALVFTLRDSTHFEAISFARWGEVVEEYSAATRVEWNVAYTPGYVIVGDW